jgi:Holliday junction resolvasome RuvABC DNA-binding subunit
MNIDVEKTAKILSRGLTALVSLRALFRSGVGIKKLLNTNSESKVSTPKRDDRKSKQLHGALVGMGYNRSEADRAVKELSEKIETESLSDLVRAALVVLNNKG